MILIPMNRLFYIFSFALLLCIPMMSPAFMSLEGSNAVTSASLSQMIWIVLIMEAALYFFIGLAAGATPSLSALIQYDVLMIFIRFVFCFVAATIYFFIHPVTHSHALLAMWVANPIMALLHIFVTMIAGPHMVLEIKPSLLTDEVLYKLKRQLSDGNKDSRMIAQAAATPIGGFVRVYSYPELGKLIGNMIGMEGYVLYTSEGLPLWQECQLNYDMEKLIVFFERQTSRLRQAQDAGGFGEPEYLIIQTEAHKFIHFQITQQFAALFIFKNETDTGDIMNRLKYLQRSARELLEMRYSHL